MLPTVTLDPSVIWMIDVTDTVEVARDAITSALEWMRPNAAGPLDLLLSSRGVNALAKADAFPAEPRFAEVLATLGLQNVISAKTLAISVSRFLASNEWIEEVVGLRDVLYHGTTIAPDPTRAIADPGLRSVSVEAIGLAALCAQEGRRHSMYGFPRQDDAHRRVLVATHIDIIEFGEDDQRIEETVEVGLDMLGSPGAWKSGLSSLQLWKDADCAADLEVAIWLAASAFEQQSACGLREFRVGTEFLETLQASGAAGSGPFAEATLSKCAQTVLLRSSLRPQPFRTSADANAPFRERHRDKAKAWRQHVTKSHQALRLMYWELPNRLIEFATLETKGEESIHEGDALPRRAW